MHVVEEEFQVLEPVAVRNDESHSSELAIGRVAVVVCLGERFASVD